MSKITLKLAMIHIRNVRQKIIIYRHLIILIIDTLRKAFEKIAINITNSLLKRENVLTR